METTPTTAICLWLSALERGILCTMPPTPKLGENREEMAKAFTQCHLAQPQGQTHLHRKRDKKKQNQKKQLNTQKAILSPQGCRKELEKVSQT